MSVNRRGSDGYQDTRMQVFQVFSFPKSGFQMNIEKKMGSNRPDGDRGVCARVGMAVSLMLSRRKGSKHVRKTVMAYSNQCGIESG